MRKASSQEGGEGVRSMRFYFRNDALDQLMMRILHWEKANVSSVTYGSADLECATPQSKNRTRTSEV
jgi:hypothetical protein